MSTHEEVSFQARSSSQGATFEEMVARQLEFVDGWTVKDRHFSVDGFEVDIVADDPWGVEHWIECKGADGKSQRKPGLLDGTTAKVTVGVAWFLSTRDDRHPYIVWTSHLPKPGTNAHTIITEGVRHGIIHDVRTLGPAISMEVEQ